MADSRIASCLWQRPSRSCRQLENVRSSEDLDPYPATDAPTSPTPSTAKSQFSLFQFDDADVFDFGLIAPMRKACRELVGNLLRGGPAHQEPPTMAGTS